jgi:hypothetical protein
MYAETTRTAPLADTVARVRALDEYLVAEVAPIEEGWHPATALAHPDSTLLAEWLARSVAEYPGAERRVAGSFFFGSYVWYLSLAAAGCYLADRRVPDLAPTNVAVRMSRYTWREGEASGEAERVEIRFLARRFAALPDDPAARSPEALVLPDAPALREWLRAQLEAHLAPLIDAIVKRTRLGKRAQWNLAADSAAAAFLHMGQSLGLAEHAMAEGLAFVRAPGSPLLNRDTGYVTLEQEGRCESFRQRGGCCLYYKVSPGNNCSTCVLRPEAERNQMLLDYMAHKHAHEAIAD